MKSKSKINLYIIIFLFLNFSLIFGQTNTITGIGIVTPTLDTTTKSGYYIPEDMKECLKELDTMIPETVKDSMEILDYEVCIKKYGKLADWMIRNWDMWDTSRIVKYFSQFGFEEPDDIGIGIFRSYWNYLNDEPIRIEIKPKYFSLGKNLFIKIVDAPQIPEFPTDPKGKITLKNSQPQFIWMERDLTLIDSLYQPVINLIAQNGFNPSDSLYYIWWPRVAKFGDGIDELPEFLTEEEFERSYSNDKSYIADFILVAEDSYLGYLSFFLINNKFDDQFREYVKQKKHFGFYLIKQRDVYKFDL